MPLATFFRGLNRRRLIIIQPAAVGYYGRSFPLVEAPRQPLVVLPFTGYLLSSLLVPIHFFIAFFCKELISRRVLLYLVVGNNGLGRPHCRLNRLNPLNGCSS